MATINGLTTLAVADVATGDYLAIYDADANTDKKTPLYEVATWTPALTFGGGSTGITYTSRAGAYVRIGTLIYVHGVVVLSSKGSSTGNAVITGLPYTSGGTADSWLILNWSGMTSSYVNMSGYIGTSTTTISIRGITAAGTASTTNVTDAGFSNTSSLFFNGAYRLA